MKIGFVVYVNSAFFTVYMSKKVDFNRFTMVHIFNLRNNKYSFYCGM